MGQSKPEFPAPAVGFSISYAQNAKSLNAAGRARARPLRHMPWLQQKEVKVGRTTVVVWSHQDPDHAVHKLRDGSTVVLIGSPQQRIKWDAAFPQAQLQEHDFALPWEGRSILIQVTSDGDDWRLWSDWCGAIPVFAAALEQGGIAGTLEPEVVAAGRFGTGDVSKSGLVQLLVLGHYIGEDTLFSRMCVLPPDCRTTFHKGVREGSTVLNSVIASDAHFGTSVDDLTQIIADATNSVIDAALSREDKWALPLSGGVDSRLIAARLAARQTHAISVTYGPAKWIEVKSAQAVARHLSLDWRRVDIPIDYLQKYTDSWLDWFGTSMHAHGMYQMPFLELMRELQMPIISGFMGDPLAGNHVVASEKAGTSQIEKAVSYDPIWSTTALQELLEFDATEQLDSISNALEVQFQSLEGELFQRQMLMDFRNRQRRLISYQTMMYDHYVGVSTPFMVRSYAAFCMSLPLGAVANRSLQLRMMRVNYPDLFRMKGTFKPRPFHRTLIDKGLGLARLITRPVPFVPRNLEKMLFSEYANTVQSSALGAGRAETVDSTELALRLVEVGFRPGAARSLQRAYTESDDFEYTRFRAVQPLGRLTLDGRSTDAD